MRIGSQGGLTTGEMAQFHYIVSTIPAIPRPSLLPEEDVNPETRYRMTPFKLIVAVSILAMGVRYGGLTDDEKGWLIRHSRYTYTYTIPTTNIETTTS